MKTFNASTGALLVVAGMSALAPHWMVSEQSSPVQSQVRQGARGTLEGRLVDSQGKPVSGARVTLKIEGANFNVEGLTDAAGSCTFSSLRLGTYTVRAEKAGMRSSDKVVALVDGASESLRLVLEPAEKRSATATPPSGQAMEFSDKPNFTVAGVTDWTAVGGHGSDATLRTSEDLARETAALRAEGAEGAGAEATLGEHASERELRSALAAAPLSYAANHDLGEYYLRAAKYREAVPLLQAALKINPARADDEYELGLACRGVGDLKQARQHVGAALAQKDSAEWHRVAGELDERLGDPLAAVRQEERAAQLDSSEENYFAWGSELLLHRAVWQAAEVFKSGAKVHPGSARLLTGWGAALFAGALYDQAAARLCEASDLEPEETEPYLFMGKIELVAPAPLPCVEQKLARFVQAQPTNALAHYFYAMAIYKRGNKSDGPRVETLLDQAVALDPKLADAYLQLGIMAFSRRDYRKAVAEYSKAIEAEPKLAEAHYRLGMAYDRTGEHEKAGRELALHDELEKAQAAAVEQERRDVKQFLVVLQGQAGKSTNP